MITLRKALPADASLLREWDEQPHVIAAAPNDIWDWAVELPKDVPWQETLLAEEDGRPVGMIQIIDPENEDTHYWGDCGPGLRAIDIWIGPPDALGRGLGTDMMRQAMARCFAAPEVEAILIDPLAGNAGARRFYERLGFRFVELRWFEEDLCAVYRIDRATWESRQT